jgi:hypothetical protein
MKIQGDVPGDASNGLRRDLPLVTKMSECNWTRVNIKLEDAYYTRAKVISVLKHMTLNEYIECAIERAVNSDKAIIDSLKKEDLGAETTTMTGSNGRDA